MVAPRIGLGQKQFHRAFRLGQAGKGGGARGINGKDQHPVRGFDIAFQPQVGLADVQARLVDQRGFAAQGLPRGGGAQGGDKVNPLAAAGRAGVREALADGLSAVADPRAGQRLLQRLHGDPRIAAPISVRREMLALVSLDQAGTQQRAALDIQAALERNNA